MVVIKKFSEKIDYYPLGEEYLCLKVNIKYSIEEDENSEDD